MEGLSDEEFRVLKERVLGSCDLSKKGSIDSDVVDLVNLINGNTNFVTTSSCSGRIILFSKETTNSKAGCKWILVSHDVVDSDELVEKIKLDEKHMVLKFDPFILHVSCRTLHHAKILQECALSGGYKNSGMVVGKKGRITFAVRSTLSLEVPIRVDGQLMVSDQYVRCLAKLVNEKMETNKIKIQEFEKLCYSALHTLSQHPT